jgi:hypothetical protein
MSNITIRNINRHNRGIPVFQKNKNNKNSSIKRMIFLLKVKYFCYGCFQRTASYRETSVDMAASTTVDAASLAAANAESSSLLFFQT